VNSSLLVALARLICLLGKQRSVHTSPQSPCVWSAKVFGAVTAKILSISLERIRDFSFC
jgi:hypothetical protein